MKKLMCIGAGFLQKYVIQKAISLGYYVIAVDGNSSAPGFQYADMSVAIDITDTEGCLRFARTQHVDGVMTAATDYGILTTALICSELGLPGIDVQTAKIVKNKFAVHNLLFQGVFNDSSLAYEILSPNDVLSLYSKMEYPVIVKPCDGSGSRGATKVNSKSELYSACVVACCAAKSGRALIEPYIDGIEYGVESFVYDGTPHVLAVMKKWMTEPPYYAELGHAIPCGLPITMEGKIKRTVEKAITELGIRSGAVNMDILVAHDGSVHIIDVGARMGGNLIGSHIIPISTGYDYIANLIRATVGDSFDLPDTVVSNSVATKILALTPGKISQLPDFAVIQQQFGVSIEHSLLVGNIISQYKTNLDGCGYIIATGSNSDDAETKAADALTEIDRKIVRS